MLDVSSQNMNKAKIAIVSSLFVLIGGCAFDSGEEWRDNPYSVLWIDTTDNRTLNFDIGNGGSVVRVKRMVVAVGSNGQYVVAQQQKDANTSLTRYYIINRLKDHKYADPHEFVTGPLSKEEYESKKTLLKLPEFTKQF
jgi:hypothetical protein